MASSLILHKNILNMGIFWHIFQELTWNQAHQKLNYIAIYLIVLLEESKIIKIIWNVTVFIFLLFDEMK